MREQEGRPLLLENKYDAVSRDNNGGKTSGDSSSSRGKIETRNYIL